MTTAGLTIQSFGGNPINDGSTYGANFVEDSRIFDTFDGTAIETERPGNWPVHVRVQPNALPIAIEIEVLDMTQDNYDQLKEWFSPLLGEQYLIATDGNSVDRRILCVVEKLTGLTNGPSIFKVNLRAASGFWESSNVGEDDVDDPEELDSPAAINDSDDTFTISNAGDTEADVEITLTPTAPKDSATAYTLSRQVTFANRSELGALDDPVNPDGYPVELSEGALTGMDSGYRLFNYGREQNRWLGDTGGKMWANLHAPVSAAQPITLYADINDTDETLEAANSRGFGTLPDAGFIVIDTERIQYWGNTGRTLTGLVRGSGGTTAASHSAGAGIFRVPHPFLRVLYGIDTPPPAFESTDLEPVIDLDNSTNALHIWPGPYYNNGDHRSRAFQRVFIDEGASSQHIRSYDDSGDLDFEDLLPAEGKPQGNNAEISLPVPAKVGTDQISVDFDVPANLLLQAFVLDKEGNESRLITQFWSDGLQTAQTYSPGNVLTRIRFNARIGAILGDLDMVGGNVPISAVALTLTAVKTSVVDSQAAEVDVTYDAILFLDCHFNLSKECEISGFILGINSADSGDTLGAQFSTDTEGLMSVNYTFPATISSPTLIYVPFSNSRELPFPAGDYRLLVGGLSADWELLYHNDSTNANTWVGYDPQVPVFALDAYSVLIQLPDQPFFHIVGVAPGLRQTPVFALVSRTSDPEPDAPLQTGTILTVANISIALDDDTPRTPLIIVGPEEEAAFYHHTWRLTDAVGRYIDVNFPGNWAGLKYDSKNHQVIDLETNLPISNVVPSDPNDWPRLIPGDNEWTLTDPTIASGVGALSVTATWRSAWL